MFSQFPPDTCNYFRTFLGFTSLSVFPIILTRKDGSFILLFNTDLEAKNCSEFSPNEDFIASYKSNGIYVAAYPEYGEYSVKNVPDAEKPVGKKHAASITNVSPSDK